VSGPAFRNHHTCGFGVIGELSTGFPGYNSIIGREHATVFKVLNDNGSATSWFGKNHNPPDFQYSTAGPFDQWPSGMGFEYFYGFMGGETVAAAIRRAYKPLCDPDARCPQ
jgi:arylsulfatase A-like enzyme